MHLGRFASISIAVFVEWVFLEPCLIVAWYMILPQYWAAAQERLRLMGRYGVGKEALTSRMLQSPWMNGVDADRLSEVRTTSELKGAAADGDTVRQRISL